jgi:hypothetical protein
LVLGCDADLLSHFDELAAHDCLPTLDDLLDQASIIRERYACQTAYEQSLDKAEQEEAPSRTKFSQGSAWTQAVAPEAPIALLDPDSNMPGLEDIPDEPAENASGVEEPSAEIPATADPKEASSKSRNTEGGPQNHKESP